MTSKVILYIATSLNGYIADKKGSVDFLSEIPQNSQVFEKMNEAIKDFKSIIMGNNTFNQITTELSPGSWPYKDQKTFVYTHDVNRAVEIQNVEFTNAKPVELIKELKQKNNRDIWLLGGANLVEQFHNLGLIDEYVVTITPIILGGGIKLFSEKSNKSLLRLKKVDKIGEYVELTYSK